MADDVEQPDVKSPWLWTAIIVGMATLFVVLLLATVLVWLLKPDRAGPAVAESWSLTENAGEVIPAADQDPFVVSPAESPTERPAQATAPPATSNAAHRSSQPASDAWEGEAPAEPGPAATPARQEPRPPETESRAPAPITPSHLVENREIGRADRVAPPDPEALAQAVQELNVTSGVLIGAATTGEAKRSVAETLLKQAGRATSAAQRYALLDQARTLAVDAGDLRLSLSAIGELGRGFQTDTQTLTAEVLKKLAGSVTGRDEHRLVAQTAVACAQYAAGAGDNDLAESLYVVALGAARELADARLEGTIQRDLEALTPATTQPAIVPAAVDLSNAVTSQEVMQANEVLKRSPRDADAHLTVGKFLCFVKEDWSAGLPHLAYGSDASLSKLARNDMLLPRTAKNVVELADAWYELGLQADPSTRKAAWSRSLDQYQAARSQLTGMRRERVEGRVAELTDALDEQQRMRALSQSWLAAPPGLVRSFEGHEQHVTALAVSADGTLLASAAEDRTVRLWNVGDGQQRWRQSTRTSHLNGLVIAPDAQFVISNYDDKRFAVFGAADGRLARQVGDSPMSPTALRLSPDGLSLIWAARSRPPNLFVWSLAKDQAVGAYGEGDCPNVLALSRDGQRIATGDSRGMVRVVETSTGKVLHQLRAHTDAITDLDFSPGGQHVASAALNEICVFDLTSYEPVQTFRVESVRTAAFSPDGRRLASGGFREEVFVWDLQTGRGFDTLKAESAFSERHITRLAFLPDPRGLVTGATGGKIRLWRLPD